MKSDDTIMYAGIGITFFIMISVSIVFVFLFMGKEDSSKKLIETPPPATVGCPTAPYNYCSTDNIQKVYYVNGCGPSTSLINKLTSEGKITGLNDPKLINCSENPDLCTAAKIKSYPSVICSNAPTSIYEGYCP